MVGRYKKKEVEALFLSVWIFIGIHDCAWK